MNATPPLPETPIDGAVAALTNSVAGFIMEAKITIPYREAVRVALEIIPMVREADRRAGWPVVVGSGTMEALR